MRVAAIVSLDISVDSPVLALLEFFDNEGVGVGVSLDVTKKPGWEGLGDVVVVDARGCIEVLDKDGVIRSSRGTHDTTLIDVFDVAGLHSESVNNDGEVRHLSSILFESLRTFDGIGGFIRVEAMLEVFDGCLTSSFQL